jgi:hypothetical protein
MTDIRRNTQSPAVLHATEASAAGGDVPVAAPAEDAVVRRTKDGWRVGGTELSDLTSAMVLADLLSAEMAASGGEPGEAEAGQAGTKPGPGARQAGAGAAETDAAGATGAAPASASHAAAGDTSKLWATIRQLEHALTARIRVEQAIGVLAERHRIQPRQAFEQLRAAARSRGRRVIDIASDVVASATNPLLQLPDELSRPRSARQSHRPRGVLGSE